MVLGGAGYIGSSLVRQLLRAGRRVRVVDNLLYGYESLLGILGHPNLEMSVGDCRNVQDMVRAIQGADSIIDLAAIVGDSACDQDKKTALEINYAATRMLIDLAARNGVRRFIFASSCSVYGANDVIMDETSFVAPVSFYGQTKVDSEHALLRAHCDAFHPVIFRLATVFGLSHRPRFDLVINLLAAKALHEGAITIFNSSQWRPFIHVHDAAAGMILALDAPHSLVAGQIFNLGDTTLNYTLQQVSEKILAAFPGTRVEYRANLDSRNYRVSFEKIRCRLGFAAAWRIEDGIRQLREAFDRDEIADYRDHRYHNQNFLRDAAHSARQAPTDPPLPTELAPAPSSPTSTVPYNR